MVPTSPHIGRSWAGGIVFYVMVGLSSVDKERSSMFGWALLLSSYRTDTWGGGGGVLFTPYLHLGGIA